MFQVDVYRGHGGFAAVSQDWQVLSRHLRRRRYFHEYGWWKSYLDALDLDPETFSVLLVRCGGEPVAILPLAQGTRKWYGLNVRQWNLPDHPHQPLNDILCRSGVAIDEIIEALGDALRQHVSGNWDMLNFTGILEESPLAEFLTCGKRRIIASLLKTCDYLPCQGPYNGIVAKFSRNFRSNLNKARNKLAREKEVEFRSVTGQPELASGFVEFLDIEASGWKGIKGAGTAIKLHPELMQFYQSLIDEFGPSGAVMINSLKVGDKTIASQFCVKDDDTLYVLKLAYDENWSRVAPGNMLLERVIEKGIRDRSFQYVNLVGDPPWFRDWRPESQNVYNIWLFNGTPAGLALFGAMKAKQWLKPYYHKYLKRNRGSAKPRATDTE